MGQPLPVEPKLLYLPNKGDMSNNKIKKYLGIILKTMFIIGFIGILLTFLLIFVFYEWKHVYWLRVLIATCIVSGAVSIFVNYIYSLIERFR